MNNQLHRQNTSQEASGEDIVQFLTFILNTDVYGINILNIKEIIDYGNVTRVPLMPEFIAGVINLRGSVVPVVDLALRFSMQTSEITKRSSIVILEIKCEDQKMEIGVTVDVVNEVLDILSSEIESAPMFGTKIRTDFISGMGKLDGELLVLLDIENILSLDEISVMGAY
ncbi:MAG TPA: chemotaxis protein CheW [Gammaproteobacteria bacterium]|nr:chemotaxis protein CheW [Gammaproteobacteria bacterium]